MDWFSQVNHRVLISAGLFLVAMLIGVVAYWRASTPASMAFNHSPAPPWVAQREEAWGRWWGGDEAEREKLVTRRVEVCPNAPFLLPAEGYIGLLYGDPRGPYAEDHRHQGVDIFSPSGAGITQVYAAYDGYITREANWTSALIIRVPSDPLQPGRQIWLYYTHMADASGEVDYVDPAFPRDTHGVFVRQGTPLGYTGNYSGNPFNPVGVHLHFSIVVDDGFGGYTNELNFNNTIDPSRYLGIAVNYACAPVVPLCDPNPLCEDAILGTSGG